MCTEIPALLGIKYIKNTLVDKSSSYIIILLHGLRDFSCKGDKFVWWVKLLWSVVYSEVSGSILSGETSMGLYMVCG